MMLRFVGFPIKDRDTNVTLIWNDGVFTAPDAASEPFLRRCLELAIEFQDKWANPLGLPAQPPGDHTKTLTGAWFLAAKVMQIDHVISDLTQVPRTESYTSVE